MTFRTFMWRRSSLEIISRNVDLSLRHLRYFLTIVILVYVIEHGKYDGCYETYLPANYQQESCRIQVMIYKGSFAVKNRTRANRSQFTLRKYSHSFRSISVCFEKVFTLV